MTPYFLFVGWHNYGIEVVRKLATEQHKRHILQAFKSYNKYVKVIYAKGWHYEFQDQLISGLEKNRGYVPGEWIKSLVELDRADAVDALIEYFKYGWNNHTTYNRIASIAGIEAKLEAAIPVAWETASQNNKYAMAELTPKALETGYRPAFKFVMTALVSSTGLPEHAFDAHALALRYTDQVGSPSEIFKWYKNNQQRIKFDPDRELFLRKLV